MIQRVPPISLRILWYGTELTETKDVNEDQDESARNGMIIVRSWLS